LLTGSRSVAVLSRYLRKRYPGLQLINLAADRGQWRTLWARWLVLGFHTRRGICLADRQTPHHACWRRSWVIRDKQGHSFGSSVQRSTAVSRRQCSGLATRVLQYCWEDKG
jgi:ribosomal protein S18 acetylase RimI-like enzyme